MLPSSVHIAKEIPKECMGIHKQVSAAVDPEGVCYKALGFSPGFAADAPVSAYLKLLPMLAGIGSPGTIQEVKGDCLEIQSINSLSKRTPPMSRRPKQASLARIYLSHTHT